MTFSQALAHAEADMLDELLDALAVSPEDKAGALEMARVSDHETFLKIGADGGDLLDLALLRVAAGRVRRSHPQLDAVKQFDTFHRLINTQLKDLLDG